MYDIISGVSAGGLNTLSLAQFPFGEERKAGQTLWENWDSFYQELFFKEWFPSGLKQGLLLEKGLFNTEVQKKTFKQ